MAKEALWRARMASQGKSGLSVRAFYRAEGLGEASFHGWRRELSLRDQEVESLGEASTSRDRTAAAASPRALFVELACREALCGEPLTPTPTPTPLEVVLRGGRVLRVREGFSPETVLCLVAVLESEGY